MSDIQNKRGTYARWMELDPILLEGEIGFIVEDTLPGADNTYKDKFKIGDGIKPFSQLPFQSAIGDLINITSISSPNYITLDTTPTNVPTTPGTISWDSGNGTAQITLTDNVTLQVGQENLALCYNNTGSALTDGEVVYISGVQGQRPKVSLASAATESTSSKTFGVVTEPIENGAEGFISTFGLVNGINTYGFNSGDAVWLSDIPGKFQVSPPVEPNHMVFIGYVVRVSSSPTSNNGSLFVNPQNGYELNELHGVQLDSSIANKELLSYNSSTGLWENKTGTEAGLAELSGATFTGSVVVGGDLTVNGTTTTINTSDLSITDPMIYLGESNPSNSLDLGIVTSFNNGTYQHSGLVRDATDGKWKLFSGVVPEPTTTVDFSNATYDPLKIGSLEATSLAVSSVSATGLISSNTFNVTSTATLSGEIKVGSTPTAGINKQVLTSKGPGLSAEWTTLQAGVQALEVAPTSPSQGDTWFNTVTGQLLVYYDTYWVEVAAGAQGPTGPTGPTGPNYTLTATSPLSVTGPTYSQTISAALATSTTNGLISGTVDQTIGGNKTFGGNVIVSGTLAVNGISYAYTPTGAVTQFAGAVAPSGWFLCDGSAVERSKYPTLFAIIGTIYGAGDGSTTFNLPDLRGRVPVGKNSGTFSSLNASGGAETFTLNATQLPSHTHSFSATTSSDGAHTHGITPSANPVSLSGYGSGFGGLNYFPRSADASYNQSQTSDSAGAHQHTVSGTTGATGNGAAVNNLQPYIVLNYIIKY